MKHEWTDADFDQISWYDNAVHGLSIIEGDLGLVSGLLCLVQIRVSPSSKGLFQLNKVMMWGYLHSASQRFGSPASRRYKSLSM
jgi:hypothetical protein